MTTFSVTPLPACQKGVSLTVVLILLVVIGITASAAMRNATSSQMLTNNVRMENIAQQYAEAALRYCEGQLQLSSAVRPNSLQNAVIPSVDMTVAGAVGAWENPLTWTAAPGGGGASSTRTVLPATQYSSASSSYLPARAPECAVETQTMGAPSFIATIVTARGFGPDYQADANGNTTHGAVVWLQSILNVNPNDLP